MTYRTLIKLLSQVPNNQLDDCVTIHDVQEDEYYSDVSLERAGDDQSVLDEGHLIIKLTK